MGRAAVLGSLVLLVGSVIVAGILVVADNGSESPASPGAQSVGGPAGGLLLWNTRESLAICIDVAGEASLRADASELRALSTRAVTEAMADVVKHPVWQRTASIQGVEVVVDPDCPGQAKMQCPERPELLPIGCESSFVTEPSPYRLFVFVVSEADLQRVTGGLTQRLTPLEHLCGGDSCMGVTTATWVSEMEVVDPGALYALVGEGLGILEPRD